MVFATPEEMQVLTILGKLLLMGCILTIVWNFLLLLVEGFNFAGMCAIESCRNVTWGFGKRFYPIMWASAILTVYAVFF